MIQLEYSLYPCLYNSNSHYLTRTIKKPYLYGTVCGGTLHYRPEKYLANEQKLIFIGDNEIHSSAV